MDGSGDCFLSEGRTDHVRTKLGELYRKCADTDRRRDTGRLIVVGDTGNRCLATGDGFLYVRCGDDLVVIDDVEWLADIGRSRICKLLRPRLVKLELDDVLTGSVLIRHARTCVLYIITGQEYLALRICKLECTRLTELLEDLICVGRTRDIDVDTIASLLVNLGLGRVALCLQLELIDGIRHLLRGRVVFGGLVGDGNTAVQIQAQLNVLRTMNSEEAETDGNRQHCQKSQCTLHLLVHWKIFLYYIKFAGSRACTETPPEGNSKRYYNKTRYD